VLSLGSAPLAAILAFSGLNYMAGVLMKYGPHTSQGLRDKGDDFINYSYIMTIFAAASPAVLSVADLVKGSIAGGIAGADIPADLGAVAKLYNDQFSASWGFLMLLAGASGGSAMIPLIGPAISIAISTFSIPIVFMLTFVMIGCLTLSVFFYLLHNWLGALLAIGSVLLAVPFKYGKPVGGFLIAFSLVSYSVAPFIPPLADILCKQVSPTYTPPSGALDLSSNPQARQSHQEIDKDWLNPNNAAKTGSLVEGLQDKFSVLSGWFAHIAASMFLFSIVTAAAAALSKELGGHAAQVSVI